MESCVEITILFDAPFWIALFERYENNSYSAAREVIGTSEPQGSDVIMFFNKLNYCELKFTQPQENYKPKQKDIGFKKQLHKNKKLMETFNSMHVFTKAQAALKNQHNNDKTELKKTSKTEYYAAIEQKFALKQLKKKEKHRGH